MKFITIGSKSIRIDQIEAVIRYRNELTIHCSKNGYTIYYDKIETAEKAHAEVLAKLEEES